MQKQASFSVIFLAGGTGTRMKANIPKQYLLIKNKPLALRSFEVFLSISEADEIIVVCEKEYQPIFRDYKADSRIIFASPGLRRQDSVYNGLQKIRYSNDNRLICVHDSARPLIDAVLVRRAVATAQQCGAAVIGVRVKSTIKLCDETQSVIQTLDRTTLWEMQTPQVINSKWLKEGFERVHAENLTVTDDVSLVELIGKPVKVVEGHYSNIKVTTPEDFILVKQILEKE